MKILRIILISIAGLGIVSCATTTGVVVSTPLSLTIKKPRNLLSGAPTGNQAIYDMAEAHCQKQGRHAVAGKAWIVPFDADYFEFECKSGD